MRAWLVKALTPDLIHVPTTMLMQITWACRVPAAQVTGVSHQEMPALCLSRAAAVCGHITLPGEQATRPRHLHNSAKPNLKPTFNDRSVCFDLSDSSKQSIGRMQLSDKTQILQTASTKTVYHCYCFKIATIKFKTNNINESIKKKKKYCLKLKLRTSEGKLNDLRNK